MTDNRLYVKNANFTDFAEIQKFWEAKTWEFWDVVDKVHKPYYSVRIVPDTLYSNQAQFQGRA